MYKRKTNVKISFDVYRISDETLAEHFEKELDIDEITYNNEIEAIDLDGNLKEWADNSAKLKALEVAASEIGSDVPDDLTITTLYGATFKAENIEGYGLETSEYGMTLEKVKEEIRKYEEQREQELIKRQQKQQKAEQKKKVKLEKEIEKAKTKPIEEIKIPVTIDTEPTVIIIKKDLTTMDIVQISRLQKSIGKLEKVRQEQEAFVNMYSERIKSERLDLLLSSTKQRDDWIDEMNRTIRKIEKQQEAIEKIKMGI